MRQFSIIVTCHNQRLFIREAVESALLQPGEREIIVVDDASSDGSVDVLRGYSDLVRLVRLEKNVGAPDARNKGADLADGEYLVFLDGDDVLAPYALQVYSRLIRERHPVIIAGKPQFFEGSVPEVRMNPSEVEFVEYDYFIAKDRPCGLYASTWLVRRHEFQRVHGWTSEIFQLDLVDQATKLGSLGRAIIVQTPITALYRVHAANSVHDVAPFMRMMHYIIGRERSGCYGGREHRFQRQAWLGGPILYWVKRAARSGLYGDAVKLLMNGWRMVLLGALRRIFVDKRPIESLPIHQSTYDATREHREWSAVSA